VPPRHLAELIGLVGEGRISGRTAKDVFERMWASGEAPRALVEREGLAQQSEAGAIRP